MKTGFGIRQKLKKLYAYHNLIRFQLKKTLFGFDVANVFFQRIDKLSLQLILKRNGATIGNNCDIESGLTFHNCNDYSNLTIGNNCHIGKNCFFDLRDKIIIGNNVVISMKCTFITHMDMSKSELTKQYPPVQAPIVIKDNAYIGSESQVLKGVIIGERAFVAAKALVVKDIKADSLVGGVPAKMIKKIKE